MQIFLCTFLIRLQYVKRVKELSETKMPSSTFQAAFKGNKNQVIATGMCKPSFLNDTAWFNQKFQIKSDLLLNPETKQYNASNITLEVKSISSLQTKTHVKSLNLSQIAQKKMISEREYQLSGGLMACLQLSCTDIQRKGFKPLRNSIAKSPEKGGSQGFLLLSKVTFGQVQKNRDTPQFPDKRASIQIQSQSQNEAVENDEGLGPQLKAMRWQFQKQLQEHLFTKQTLRSKKELLEKQYNINRQLTYAIESLNKKIQQYQRKEQSQQNHLLQTQNLCNALSASLSSKETEIVQMHQLIDDLGQKIVSLSKKNQAIHHLERAKGQLQLEVNGLRKQLQQSKLQLTRQYLQEKELSKQIDSLRFQNSKLIKSNEQIKKQLSQAINKQAQYKVTIAKITEEKDTIKSQTTRWRTQFCAQAQRKDQQINQLEQHCRQLYSRYSQIHQKQDVQSKMVDRQLVNTMRKEYEVKLEQYQQKQAKLRHYIEVIDQQTFNLQEMLQQKESNEQILLQTIKKLQTQIQTFSITNNWWQAILQKQKQAVQNGLDQKSQLVAKNKKLVQILHKNSFTILQGERTKVQLLALRKEYEQHTQKGLVIQQQYKQMREKVNNLYKQNKKLQEKNYLLTKEKQSTNKKNAWLEELIKQSKLAQKQARRDYEIVSFQMIQMQKRRKKQEKQMQNAANCLSVIRQKSEEHLASSHKFVRQSSIKQNFTAQSETQTEVQIYGQLQKILQQRAKHAQQFNWQFQKAVSLDSQKEMDSMKKIMSDIRKSTSKTKLLLVRSGNKQLIGQWEQLSGCLLAQIQQFVSIV